MPSNKTFRTKVILAKASKQNRYVLLVCHESRCNKGLMLAPLYSPIPQWFRLKSDTKIQYNGAYPALVARSWSWSTRA